ncbi:oleoyl-[acyl-carrier protein] thioesterase [Paucilactobacillus oligofermentans DSM 15707 = LMG 22743]|uniref:Oleoyl-[acyl-carrier protein] thioesterase n=1 Tax=Paucilactobacillus oligofermentans DSM 15707 = LMG 22743 TaxID=1423778 RepID=A0A0R1RMK8_9LACO|nr:oleoyl-[acyl-carrier protein] thioesterase [Paucilactobacillus oligofermentans DSM 15707 = LMG 22743]
MVVISLEQNEYSMKHTVTYYECDPQGNVTVGMLINLAILVSEKQSDAVGLGPDIVGQFGGGWVITNYNIEITKLPKVGETVVLSTRATSYNRYFAFREFWIRDQAGNEYAHIASIFVYMDLTTRKMVQIPNEILQPFHSEEVKRIPRVGKLEAITSEELLLRQDYHVRYFDIDANQHVNNAHYFDWMLDVLGEDFMKTHRLKKMLIKYELEVRYGKDLVTSEVAIDDATLMTKHRIGTQGNLNAEANCWWEKLA